MRTWKLDNGHVKYMKDHGWKNQYSSLVTHGCFECNRILGIVLGMLWKCFGVRVLR